MISRRDLEYNNADSLGEMVINDLKTVMADAGSELPGGTESSRSHEL
jgi:hypothetical protein